MREKIREGELAHTLLDVCINQHPVCHPSPLPVSARKQFADLLRQPGPLLALAPMQDVTDLGFWRLMTAYGGADVCVTEFFRVTPDSRLDRDILRSITENPTGRPVIAQMIGNDIPNLVRTALELEKHPVAAIDLNLGCPAPIVYRKCAGGGLLREPQRVDAILGALRQAVSIPFTVKTRLGFESPALFGELLGIFAKHQPDLVTVHGRTVADMYRPTVRYDLISQAVATLRCPVLANGDVTSPGRAAAVLLQTRARGLMIGRGAVRNPWLFGQIRQHQRGEPVTLPTGRQVLDYIRQLYEVVTDAAFTETERVHRVKKHLNFLGPGLPDATGFLHAMRRTTTLPDLLDVCAAHLEHEKGMTLE